MGWVVFCTDDKCQGCSLFEDGAHLAASRRLRVFPAPRPFGIGARLQRLRNRSGMGWLRRRLLLCTPPPFPSNQCSHDPVRITDHQVSDGTLRTTTLPAPTTRRSPMVIRAVPPPAPIHLVPYPDRLAIQTGAANAGVERMHSGIELDAGPICTSSSMSIRAESRKLQ